ncbi:MAG: hypothetical protein DRH30_14785 [Deltaproteobacteria bacterium]|nr:MAG: hypothetical protein DRH30_14785 [Deltaproteobacteria bacterium]
MPRVANLDGFDPMKRLFPALALLTVCASVWLAPASASAVPKLDIKIFFGVGSTSLVPRLPEFELPSGAMIGGREPTSFFSWQGGLAARVRSGKVFGEISLGFSRFNFQIGENLVELAELEGRTPEQVDAIRDLVGNDAKMNSLELPITAGYVPYANPYFKLFLYGGLVNKFNIKGFVDTNSGGEIKFRPKDIPGFPFVIYQAGARLGVAFDLGPLNFDFNYTIGMNSITKTEFRTNSHVTQMNLGWLF